MENLTWMTISFVLFQVIVSKIMYHSCNGKEYDLLPVYEEPPDYEEIINNSD